MLNRENERREEKKKDEREREWGHEWSHNSQELFDYCFDVNSCHHPYTIGYVFFLLLLLFWSSSSMYAWKCLGVRLSPGFFLCASLLLLINRSSLFDNNDDHDYITQLPTGDRRLKFFFLLRHRFFAISIDAYIVSLVYVRRLAQRWKDWLVIRRRGCLSVYINDLFQFWLFMYTHESSIPLSP